MTNKTTFASNNQSAALISQAQTMFQEAKDLAARGKKANAASVIAKIKNLLRNESHPHAQQLRNEVQRFFLEMVNPTTAYDPRTSRMEPRSRSVRAVSQLAQYKIDYPINAESKSLISGLLSQMMPFVQKAMSGSATLGEIITFGQTALAHFRTVDREYTRVLRLMENYERTIRDSGVSHPNQKQSETIQSFKHALMELGELRGILAMVRAGIEQSPENQKPGGGQFLASRSGAKIEIATEDKFYFRRATDSEIETLLLEANGRFSRPGSPDKFDASSLDRGNFAEASKSPMLGKLLSAKVMPEGGWRAVQVGSDTLVISFEDADLARDFGRRASTKGYNATSPVATTGRYWNVEVKNGK